MTRGEVLLVLEGEMDIANRRFPGVPMSLLLGRITAVVLATCGSASGMASVAELEVGMQAEPTLLMFVLRAAVAVWAVALLLMGAKMPRLVVGTLLIIIGIGVGAFIVATASIPAALALAWLVAAAGSGLYIVAPRLVMALALFWPLPALYGANLFFSGSFERSMPLAVGLTLTGVVIGAVFPKRSLVLLAVALGTVLLLSTGLFGASLAGIVVIAAAAAAWQIVVLKAWRFNGTRRGSAGVRQPSRRDLWHGSMRWAALVLVAGLLLVSLTAPSYDAGSVASRARMDVLTDSGALSRPGIVFGKLNNYYLSNRGFPVALVGEKAGPAMRIAVLFVGRSLSGVVRGMRAVKSDTELEAMRHAADITSAAFEDIHPLIRPGVSEADIDRAIRDSFARHGATGIAFPGIVGSGPNAVLPHYQKNDAVMSDGLVVIDIGCAVNGYASDMTRTFSVSGSYGEAERMLIETVISAGDAARSVLASGATMGQVDDASRRVIDGAGFRDFYTHSVGHHVGLDVHDPGRSPLEPGMVVTIEPGIYIPEGADVDPMYWNLGVRIEDSYIVTETGWEEITSYPRRPY